MNHDVECGQLCSVEVTKDIFKMQSWVIDRDYHYSWFMDNLPSAFVSREDNEPVTYISGIPIGEVSMNINENGNLYRQYSIYNHHDITIELHENLNDNSSFTIVGFKVEPRSVV
mmetsp:Transcript_20218/g.19158  ORF Transcript_20218/g.19158 Transcript_20218/m.19158 type:complete len:114 (+) Transcript_20218:275-616(+)